MFKYITSGESHGPCLTAIIQGVPAGVEIDEEDINIDLKRRQCGYGRGARMQIESDQVLFLGGIRNGRTTGAPVTLQIQNRDWANWHKKHVEKFTVPRPGHADLIGSLKYETDDIRDILERSSARETAIRVAVGGLAKTILGYFEIAIHSHTVELGGIAARKKPGDFKKFVDTVEKSELRCYDKDAEKKMVRRIKAAQKQGDSVGGIIEVIVKNTPMCLGTYSTWNDKIDALLAYSLMSIQAIKGVEVGLGFRAARMLGSQMHDEIYYSEEGKRYFRETNNAGGIEGGMTNGEDLIVRAAMKPIPTLMKPLKSVNIDTKKPSLATTERSDVCAVPAAGVVCEAVVAIELVNSLIKRYGGDNIKMMKRHIDIDGDAIRKN
ncbi:MAG: chorismate synthase [Spirochaetes bacterium]|nr:chorismate synthase [Spirochaetota bacterium]